MCDEADQLINCSCGESGCGWIAGIDVGLTVSVYATAYLKLLKLLTDSVPDKDYHMEVMTSCAALIRGGYLHTTESPDLYEYILKWREDDMIIALDTETDEEDAYNLVELSYWLRDISSYLMGITLPNMLSIYVSDDSFEDETGALDDKLVCEIRKMCKKSYVGEGNWLCYTIDPLVQQLLSGERQGNSQMQDDLDVLKSLSYNMGIPMLVSDAMDFYSRNIEGVTYGFCFVGIDDGYDKEYVPIANPCALCCYLLVRDEAIKSEEGSDSTNKRIA